MPVFGKAHSTPYHSPPLQISAAPRSHHTIHHAGHEPSGETTRDSTSSNEFLDARVEFHASQLEGLINEHMRDLIADMGGELSRMRTENENLRARMSEAPDPVQQDERTGPGKNGVWASPPSNGEHSNPNGDAWSSQKDTSDKRVDFEQDYGLDDDSAWVQPQQPKNMRQTCRQNPAIQSAIRNLKHDEFERKRKEAQNNFYEPYSPGMRQMRNSVVKATPVTKIRSSVMSIGMSEHEVSESEGSHTLGDEIVDGVPVSRKSAAGTSAGDRLKDGQAQLKEQPKCVFADAAAMKEQVRKALMKKEYNVADFYYDSGRLQKLARSQPFEYLTLFIIAFNAIWISVDADLNTGTTMLDAPLTFQIAEHGFCFYFTFEILVRFFSFAKKRNCLRDAWFVFDAALVTMMVCETWVMTLVLVMTGAASGGGGLGDTSVLKLVRLVRLTRMARMAKLLRAVPELIILIKGVVVASRSVGFTLVLLMILTYFFAIVFRQLTDDTVIGDMYFPSVPDSMMSLILDAVLPDQAAIVRDASDAHAIFGMIMLLYILLASLMLMNMLLGVLCEVVSIVSAVEKEELTVGYVKARLYRMFTDTQLDEDGSMTIDKDEFEKMLLIPEAAQIINEIGVDVVGLVDFADFIFHEGNGELSFADFMELVLSFRGSNGATVKDVVDLRKFTQSTLQTFLENIQTELNSISRNVKKDCRKLGEEVKSFSVYQKSQPDALIHATPVQRLPLANGGGIDNGSMVEVLNLQEMDTNYPPEPPDNSINYMANQNQGQGVRFLDQKPHNAANQANNQQKQGATKNRPGSSPQRGQPRGGQQNNRPNSAQPPQSANGSPQFNRPNSAQPVLSANGRPEYRPISSPGGIRFARHQQHQAQTKSRLRENSPALPGFSESLYQADEQSLQVYQQAVHQATNYDPNRVHVVGHPGPRKAGNVPLHK